MKILLALGLFCGARGFAQSILYFPGYEIPLVARETAAPKFRINVNPASIYPPVTLVEAKKCYEASVSEIASFLKMPMVARSLKPLESARQPFGGLFEVYQFLGEGREAVRMRSSALMQVAASVNPRTHHCEVPDARRLSEAFAKFLEEHKVSPLPAKDGSSLPVASLPTDWKKKYANIDAVPYEPRRRANAELNSETESSGQKLHQ